MSRQTLEDRFWTKVDRRGPEECWPWTAAIFRGGYGQFRAAGRSIYAHRVAFLLVTGQDPGPLQVRHRCDNPACCNPSHLEVGTHADNMRDKAERGRVTGAILTPEKVREIRRRVAAGESQTAVARDLGVGRRTVRDAVNRRTWKHVK